MGVQKFRSFEEAERALWSEGGSEQNLRRLEWLYGLWSALTVRHPWRGVHRYRSLEEANASRNDWHADPLRTSR